MRVMRLGAARNVAARAIEAGATRSSLSTFQWDVAGRCESPVPVEIEGRADTRRGESGMPVAIQMETRCRRCRTCLRYRAWLWRVRAQAEVASAQRSWFVTLTLRPEEHWLAELRADAACRRRGVSFASLSPSEQFAERHRAIGVDLTHWLKRIRKNSGAKLRYILVCEAHKSGMPHYHGLIHEVSGSDPVTKRHVQEAWQLGFSQVKLVEGAVAAAYVTKYLSKSVLARVRASLRYGSNALSWRRMLENVHSPT